LNLEAEPVANLDASVGVG